MMNGIGMYGSGWLIGMSMMLLFWVLIVLLAIWVVRNLFPHQVSAGRDQALEILRQRYAAGEIDAAEYERACAQLKETPVA